MSPRTIDLIIEFIPESVFPILFFEFKKREFPPEKVFLYLLA